ncbi:AAA-domain-containing protein [Venturia nashicola]|nr:AAA-domain-containing protein [Venturia nashicola]
MKLYSLRPMGNAPKPTDPGLERMFRIEMKKDEMVAENLIQGESILLECPDTNAGGVGTVYQAQDTSKSTGKPTIKIYDPLKKCFGLTMEDKCTISKFNGKIRRARKVVVTDVSTSDNPVVEEIRHALEYWVGSALGHIPYICPGYAFDIRPRLGSIVFRTRRYKILEIVEDRSNATETDGTSTYIPYEFDPSQGEIEISGSSVPIAAKKEVRVELEIPNLKGLDRQLERLREHVESINHLLDGRFKQESLMLPSPILLHGSTGVGKTAVLHSLKKANWSKVVQVDTSQVEITRKKFTEALSSQPSLVILDDLETIAGRDSDSGPFVKELSKQIRNLSGSRVQVVAATKQRLEIGQKLLGVFAKCTIELSIPTRVSRVEILKDLVPTRTSEELRTFVASRTNAFTAEDLATLCDRASRCAFTRCGGMIGWLSTESSTPLQITREDFDQALRTVHPTTMAELYIEVPEVRWSDIAGSTEVKKTLQRAVELPLKRPDLVKSLNLRTHSGILMYGPPGCSKTLTAKALATESGLNFIAVQGPALVSKYVGETEQKIRDIFRKAREAAPSVIFFDEIDSIAPNRGSGHEGLNTVATLLNEMDGVEAVTKVLVLAATNRPEAIDPALLRPGRLGATIFVGPPDKQAIKEILKMHTDKMKKADDLGLEDISQRMIEDEKICYSGADVADLCHTAANNRAGEALEKNENDSDALLRKSDLEAALLVAKPSLIRESVETLRSWTIAGVNKVG